ncbi:MAG: endonuclease/exonuclease/phosphatase family protein [Paludibacteraceae bacterium]|nr:endonuclease/exonuclease/phosphatase family protein [Paludibacteraceae bacterium]
MLTLLLVWILYSLVSHRFRQPKETFSHTLKVMTYNTHAMMIGDKLAAKKEMLQYINNQGADVVCLQEVLVYKNPARLTLPALREAMSNYPYTYYDFKRYNSHRQFGNVVFSRYPLTNKNTIRYESQSNISSQCDILVGDDTIRLIVNHLESYGLVKEDLQFDTLSMAEIKNSSLVQKLQHAGKLRHQQAREVKRSIRQSPYPVVVVGDFNAIPLSYVYWKVKFGLRDCFLESSFGKLGNTIKKGPLGIRIDYILCSRELSPIKCEVDRVSYSDHFPVCATIGW